MTTNTSVTFISQHFKNQSPKNNTTSGLSHTNLQIIILKTSICSVANNGRSSAIANRLRTLVGKKTWKLQKWPTTFHTHTHTHTQRILKLPNLKDLFFFHSFFIQLQLNFFQNSDTQGTCIRHIRVWTNVELEWIAHTWKQFLFFLHETLRDY